MVVSNQTKKTANRSLPESGFSLRYERMELPGINFSRSEVKDDACIFCRHSDPDFNSVIRRRGTMFARWDNFPASRGHVEIVPFRHVRSYFDLTEKEVKDMHILALAIKDKLEAEYGPDSYTIGINDGAAAGQTVPHVHLHIIPRWYGDVPDPRGGIRNIFPECNPDDWANK